MDLGCLDMCCIDKNSYDPTSGEREISAVESPTTASTLNSKIVKTKMMKEMGKSTSSNGLNKLTSQVKKPPHRKNSPINWFPRKKVDSYLERKIKMMQEGDGLNLTLDETLDDSNPHYCRVLREKIAAREAAHKAVEARKAALVEASWCRILKAARIQRKEAEIQLEKAEKAAAVAVEAATALGVIMNDKPRCPKKPSRIEMSSKKGGEFTTLTVTASFVTPFEVDREVAAAVKAAFLHLASTSSFSKDDFKDLLQKISQNPDGNLAEFSSECESVLDDNQEKNPSQPILQKKQKRRLSLEKLTKEKIVDIMVERLKGLHEDQLSSLATIVATCGLNAALAEIGSSKIHEHNRRTSSSCSSRTETDLPSLDEFLVKHETKLEREIREAKNTKRDDVRDEAKGNENENGDANGIVSLELPGLEEFLVKHVSKLEREIQEAKTTDKSINQGSVEEEANAKTNTDIPSLDKILVKHVSRLEQEVLEARNKRKHDALESANAMKFMKRVSSNKLLEKENLNLNEEEEEQGLDKIMIKPMSRLEKEKMLALSTKTDYEYQKSQKKKTEDNCESLDKILVKPIMSRLEREKLQASSIGNNNYEYKKRLIKPNVDDFESLDKVLLKHVSRLDKEKMNVGSKEDYLPKVKRSEEDMNLQKGGGLEEMLVKHKLETKRAEASSQQPVEEIKVSVSRKQAREKELQDCWGGLSLSNSMMKPHLSKLEKDKAAWIKAEEEERKKAPVGM